ncbi:Hypothetical predicted protein, partial [Podarcis lilfordi]
KRSASPGGGVCAPLPRGFPALLACLAGQPGARDGLYVRERGEAEVRKGSASR